MIHRLKHYFSVITLIGVPVIFISLALMTRNLQGPYYQAFNFDPSYAYLMNSLNIACGERPGHTDHPGTSIQLLGGCILKISSFIDRINIGPNDICLEVLKNPELYLSRISNVFIFLVGVTVFLFGLSIYFCTKRLILSILSQAFPLSFCSLILHLPSVEPEPILVATAYLIAALMVPFVISHDSNLCRSCRNAIIAGIIIGFGVVSKITFAPFIFLVFVFRGYKARLSSLTAVLLTIITLTIPIWDKATKVFNWTALLMTHSGRYGKGPIGLPTSIQFIDATMSLWRVAPELFYLIPILFAAIVVNLKYTISNSIKRVLLISAIVLISDLAINVKHPSSDGHYLIPIMAFSGFLIFSVVFALYRWNTKLIVGIMMIFCIFNTLTAIGNLKRILLNYQSEHNNFSNIEDIAKAKYSCLIVPYYRSSSKEYALQFGNDYARKAHTQCLMKIYPDYVSYNVWGQYFDSFFHYSNNKVPPLLQQNTYPVCLIGTTLLPHDGQPKVFDLKTEGKVNLYQFLGFNEEGSGE